MLILHVTRHNIVTDTLQQLSRQGPADLKKPLKVKIFTVIWKRAAIQYLHVYVYIWL